MSAVLSGVKSRPAVLPADHRVLDYLRTMQTTTAGVDKRSATERDVALITETEIRTLEDEQTDELGCRFAAVARSLEMKSVPNTHFDLPVTRVAYVDESGRYAIEREFFGHRPDWHEIPRTAVVTDESAVSPLPADHRDRYADVLASYQRILSED